MLDGSIEADLLCIKMFCFGNIFRDPGL
jgi:hypothetical protein